MTKNSTCCFNWCQDTIGFQKGSSIEGEQDFIKSYHGSLKWFHFAKLMIQVWLCAPKWISHEFLAYLKIIQNSFFLAHNHPPIMNWGGARKLFKISDTFKPDHISLPKMFFNVFKSIEIQNLKGFDILDQGRECDLNMKSDKKWSISFGLNNRLPHMCQMLWLNTMHILRGSGKRLWKYLKETDQFTFNAWSYKEG